MPIESKYFCCCEWIFIHESIGYGRLRHLNMSWASTKMLCTEFTLFFEINCRFVEFIDSSGSFTSSFILASRIIRNYPLSVAATTNARQIQITLSAAKRRVECNLAKKLNGMVLWSMYIIIIICRLHFHRKTDFFLRMRSRQSKIIDMILPRAM